MAHPKVLASLDKLATNQESSKKVVTPKIALRCGVAASLLVLAFMCGFVYDRHSMNERLTVENIEDLTVAVSQNIGLMPSRLWADLEQHSGKKIEDMSPVERVEAINYLLTSLSNQPNVDEMSVW